MHLFLQKNDIEEMFEFIMIGRQTGPDKEVRKIVWVKGILDTDIKDKERIRRELEEKFFNVFEDFRHPLFSWTDISLREEKEETMGKWKWINIKKAIYQKMMDTVWHDEEKMYEIQISQENIEQFNGKLNLF